MYIAKSITTGGTFWPHRPLSCMHSIQLKKAYKAELPCNQAVFDFAKYMLKISSSLIVYVLYVQSLTCVIAEPKGEASNRGARVAVSLYVCIQCKLQYTRLI